MIKPTTVTFGACVNDEDLVEIDDTIHGDVSLHFESASKTVSVNFVLDVNEADALIAALKKHTREARKK